MDTFFYDSFGRLKKQTRLIDGRSYSLETTGFDLLNRPLTVKYPTNEVVTVAYDREGENTLKAGNDGVVDEVRYNARGQMTLLDRGGSNSNTTYGYFGATGSNGNNNFRLFTIQHGSVTDAWPDMTYTYDTVGNILTVNSSASGVAADNQTFEYDDLSRLKSAVATGGAADYAKVTYTYSEIGNILTFEGNSYNYKDVGWNTNCTAPGQTMPHAVRKIGSQYFCYDANGNMTKRFDGTTTYEQNFDVENRLASVVVGSSTTTFAYDASGQRVKTVEPAGKTTYFPFPNYEETVVGSSTIKRSSYALAGQVVAFRVTGDPVTANNGLFFIYGDHLGSTSVLQKSGDTQPVAGSWARYRPYGSYRTTPTQTLTDRDFTGQRENRELGLLYYQARYYLPGVGRFISADTIVPSPADPQQFNRYTYSLNSPVKYTDPSGHCGADLNEDGSINQDLFDQCVASRDALEGLYDISITGKWRFAEMVLLQNAVIEIVNFFKSVGASDGNAAFRDRWNGVTVERVESTCGYGCTTSSNKIKIGDVAFGSERDESEIIETFAHELAHIWDKREWRSPSRGLREEAGGRNECVFLFFGCRYRVDDPSPASSAVQEQASRIGWNYREDWAYTFSALVVRPDDVTELRKSYVTTLINGE
ncbi:MAG: RHS repeat-associated core domain-containing protein [Ardenticatenaceae bacterium]|nr:RHS repeat-associated core domain-containing protein [Ardenticatenaceae bacterium]